MAWPDKFPFLAEDVTISMERFQPPGEAGPYRMRHIYSVLSPKALPYAELGLSSMFRNTLEDLDVTLITDSESDKLVLEECMARITPGAHHRWRVFDARMCDDLAAERFRGLDNIQEFRRGHPCWRKITDPLLFARGSGELILLDPDLYFPNRFAFEPTPARGLLLMWQYPNCLFPANVVETAISNSVRLAHHVDIGVAHWRADNDLAWCDWLIGKLGGPSLPRLMHVEAIIWSALAMRLGGGHLDPRRWLCWRQSHFKRVLLKAGVPGTVLLRSVTFSSAKCFHGGGAAKWWIPDACSKRNLDCNRMLDAESRIRPFVELTPARYRFEQGIKSALRKSGYYALINPD